MTKIAQQGRPISSLAKQVFADPYCCLAFGFGSGLAPVAPGTFGTLAALPLYIALSQLPTVLYLAAVAVLFVVGISICRRCESRLGVPDHPGIVWDEIVGYLIAMSFVPVSWQAATAGFLLFRLFDIAKPWPISLADRKIHGGLGIMLDDALAGAGASICLGFLGPWTGW